MIKVNNITKIYDRKDLLSVTALNNVSFEIKQGDIVSILGKSGSGKTTLANIILGVSKPTTGEVIIDNNISINKKSKKKDLRKITDILLSSFQYPDHQLFKPTVKEEILFNSTNEKYMMELLKEFNLDDSILEQSPYKLSSGQKRKVILISLLIQEPKIILFDEATAFLDPASRREFIDLLVKVNKKFKTTMLFISHNIEDVKRVSNKAILLDHGDLWAQGSTEEVLDIYLGGGKNE